jgi:hypothetical protein
MTNDTNQEASRLWQEKQNKGRSLAKVKLIFLILASVIGLALMAWGLWVVALN